MSHRSSTRAHVALLCDPETEAWNDPGGRLEAEGLRRRCFANFCELLFLLPSDTGAALIPPH